MNNDTNNAFFLIIKETYAMGKKNNELLSQIKEKQNTEFKCLNSKVENLEKSIDSLKQQNEFLLNMLSIKTQTQTVKDMINDIDSNIVNLHSQINNITHIENIDNQQRQQQQSINLIDLNI